MPTQEELYSWLDQADKAGNTEDARDIYTMIQAGDFDDASTNAPEGKAPPIQAGVRRKRSRNSSAALRTDENFNQEGVKDFGLRAEVSQGDTPQERELLLAERVGLENVTRDKFGNLAVTAAGAAKLGIETEQPLLFDEPGASVYDIADLRGDAPAIVAGTAAGVLTGGMSLIPSMAVTALATMGGKGYQEAWEAIQGKNRQSAGEVATDLAEEGALAAGGEVLGRGVISIGRKLLQPGAQSLKEGGEQAMKESLEMGIIPRIDNLRRGAIIKRMHGVVDTIFGDRNAAKNSAAINKQMESLRKAFNQTVVPDPDEIGLLIKQDVVNARQVFARQADDMYAMADDILNGTPVMNIKNLQEMAGEILEGKFPTTTDPSGFVSPSSLEPGVLQSLKKIQSWDPNQTLSAVQTVRRQLRNRLDTSKALTPGPDSHIAGLLVDSMDDTFNNLASTVRNQKAPNIGTAARQFSVAKDQAMKQLDEANKFYSNGIEKFKSFQLQKIVKDPSLSGSLDPEEVVEFALKKKTATSVNRIMEVLPPERQAQVRTIAMDKILTSMTSGGETALDDAVFNGTTFRKTLDKMGDNTLNALFGEAHTKQMRVLASSIELASRTSSSNGGLVAASIAVRPLQNLGTLAKLGLLRNLMSSEATLKWLTTGIRLGPNTTEGAKALARLAAQVKVQSDRYAIGAGFNENTAPGTQSEELEESAL